MDAERPRHRHRNARQYRVDRVQRRRDEEEGVLQRLGDPRDERGQRHRQHQAPDLLAPLRLRAVRDGQRRRRQGEHHDREEAGQEQTRVRVAAEEHVDVAVHHFAVRLREAAELEPHRHVQELVQADHQQRPVRDAEDARTPVVQAHQPVGEALQRVTDRRPDPQAERGEGDRNEGHDDRDEPAAVEEAEPVDQLHPVVALPEPRGQQAHDDAAEHPRVLEGVLRERVVRPETAAADVLRPVGAGHRERAQDAAVDEEAGHRRQRRRTVGLLRHPDRNTDAEQERQAEIRIEQGATRRRHHLGDLRPDAGPLGVDQPQPVQDAGRGQHRDRQLQAPPHLLQPLVQAVAPGRSWYCGGAARTHRRLPGRPGFLAAAAVACTLV